jgi:hypothetical protein
MPAHLKAFVVVLVLGLAMLHLLGKLLTPGLMSPEDFARRRKAWLLITAAAFLSGNFWLYAAACIVIARYAVREEPNPLALFCFVLFTVPLFSKVLQIGPVMLVPVDHQKFLSFALLVPLAVTLHRDRHSRPRGPVFIDVMVASYLGYLILAGGFQQSFTSTIRMAFQLCLEIGLVYYVTSRSLTTLHRFREVIAAIVGAIAIAALVAIAETAKSWWIYDTLRGAFGFPGAGYISRGNMSLLRAKATLGHPIVLGFAIGIALMLLHTIYRSIPKSRLRLALLLTFIAGILVPFSRGPWVGAVGGTGFLTVSGPGKGKRIRYAITALLIAALIMAVTPFGQDIYQMLPFIHGDKNTESGGSVVYRQNLWDTSIEVLNQNLWFGDMDYLSNPMMQKMIQGEGIIDMVNSYLQIAMAFGMVGLGLFLLVLLGCWNSLRVPHALKDERGMELQDMQRGLRAALVVMALTIATCSNIEYVPAIIWLLVGLSAGFARITSTELAPTPPVAARGRSGRRQRTQSPANATPRPSAAPSGQASQGSSSPRRLPIPRRALK